MAIQPASSSSYRTVAIQTTTQAAAGTTTTTTSMAHIGQQRRMATECNQVIREINLPPEMWSQVCEYLSFWNLRSLGMVSTNLSGITGAVAYRVACTAEGVISNLQVTLYKKSILKKITTKRIAGCLQAACLFSARLIAENIKHEGLEVAQTYIDLGMYREAACIAIKPYWLVGGTLEVLKKLVKAHQENENPAEAMRIVMSVDKRRYRGALTLEIAKVQAAKGQFEDARITVETLEEGRARNRGLEVIRTTQAVQDKHEDAEKAVGSGFGFGSGSGANIENSTFEQAKVDVDKRRRYAFERQNDFKTIAYKHALMGNIKEAKEVASSFATRFKKNSPFPNRMSGIALTAVATGLIDSGQLEEAEYVIADLEELGEAHHLENRPPNMTGARSLRFLMPRQLKLALAEGWIQKGEYDRALTIANAIVAPSWQGLKDAIKIKVAKAQAEEGLYAEAAMTAGSTRLSSTRQYSAQEEVARVFPELEAFPSYLSMIDAMPEDSEYPKSRRPKHRTCLRLVTTLLEADRFEDAKKTISRMHQQPITSQAIGKLAIAQAQSGFYLEAKESTDKIEYCNYKIVALLSIGKSKALVNSNSHFSSLQLSGSDFPLQFSLDDFLIRPTPSPEE